jgi:hypothetical protein
VTPTGTGAGSSLQISESSSLQISGPPTLRRDFFRAEMLFTIAMPTHAEKNRGRRVLFPLQRANTAAFGLYDRAAGQNKSY